MKKLEAILWFIIFFILGVLESIAAPFLRVVAAVAAFKGKGKFKQWGINVWEGVDNMVSAETGGDPDDSMSSRLGKASERGSIGWSFIANRVDLIAEELTGEIGHCSNSIERDEGKKQVTHY